MADIPDIVIRTAEEREAAHICFVELRSGGRVSLVVTADTPMKENATKFLVFEDREAALLWAAARTRELSSEGVEVYGGLRVDKLREFPDRRVSIPYADWRSHGLVGMLEW